MPTIFYFVTLHLYSLQPLEGLLSKNLSDNLRNNLSNNLRNNLSNNLSNNLNAQGGDLSALVCASGRDSSPAGRGGEISSQPSPLHLQPSHTGQHHDHVAAEDDNDDQHRCGGHFANHDAASGDN